MRVYTSLPLKTLEELPDQAKRAEALGFDGITLAETAHDPFGLLAVAAVHTKRVALGTSIAIAFTRSPMSIAHTAWDLQTLSHGRFELGLGTSLKPLNEHLYSVPWSHPASRMREYVQSLRAIWDCWQKGTPLNYQGKHYAFSLMTTLFNPGPMQYPAIPVYIAAVGPLMCRLVGECCDGILTHGFSTQRYIQEAVLPLLRQGAEHSSRSIESLSIAGGGYICTGATEDEVQRAREDTRRSIPNYAMVRTYKGVMDIQGWGDTCLKLRQLMVKGQQDQMPALITDEMLNEFCVSGKYDEIAPRLKERYASYASRISLAMPSHHRYDDRLGALIEELHR